MIAIYTSTILLADTSDHTVLLFLAKPYDKSSNQKVQLNRSAILRISF